MPFVMYTPKKRLAIKHLLMKKTIFILFLSFISSGVWSQEMTIKKLQVILEKVSDTIVSNKSRSNFTIGKVPFIAIADDTHNRMRIMSPITESDKLTEELKTAALIANFHTALDIKYAITDGVLWSIFIHPLKELSEDQVIDAVSQVFYGNVNFGTSFSSSSLVFPGTIRNPENGPEMKKHKSKTLEKI